MNAPDGAGQARRRGASPVLWAVLGLLVWAVHFFAVYAANALACERAWAGAVPAAVAVATALALAALGGVLWAARPALRRAAAEGGEEEPRFSLWLSAATAALAALAVVFQAIPAALVGACG